MPRVLPVLTLTLAAALLPQACARAEAQRGPALSFDQAFWKHWSDGQAELSGYTLRFPRYGAVRTGTAVAIFVTETFSRSLRVKADPGQHPAEDEVPVMKLNWVQDFPTGIYDYNTMLSSFVALADGPDPRAGEPLKTTYSAQEWCGQAYAQVLFDRDRVRFTSHSYFDGEADQETTLARPEGTFAEDTLLLWARGFAAPRLSPGESVERPLLRSLERVRLDHVPLAIGRVELAREKLSQTLEHGGRAVPVDVYSARVDGDRTWRFFVEAAEPRRILRLTRSDGLEATLRSTVRNQYWRLNGPGGEQALRGLGLH